MLIKKPLVEALNQQIVEEFSASAQYVAISLHFEADTLPELADYFYAQAMEEHDHAMKMLRFLTEAGAKGMVPGAREPKNHFETVEEAVQLALDQEMKVTDQINALVDLAVKENDHLTHQFLQWFVSEQLEEVSSMSALLTVVQRAGEDNLLLIEDYLARTGHPEAGGAGGE